LFEKGALMAPFSWLKIQLRHTIVNARFDDTEFMKHHSSQFALLPARGSRGLSLLSALLLLPLRG
jgi:hypothetical protein